MEPGAFAPIDRKPLTVFHYDSDWLNQKYLPVPIGSVNCVLTMLCDFQTIRVNCATTYLPISGAMLQ